MKKYTVSCDRCGKEADSNRPDKLPNGWENVTILLGYKGGYGKYEKRYDICETCLEKWGIPLRNKPIKYTSEGTVQDLLVELIEELVRDAVERERG